MILPALLLAAGCSDGLPDNRGRLTGTVTIDGELAGNGAMNFTPVDGSGPTAGAKVVDGKFTAVLPVGTNKVAIFVPKVVGKRKLYNTPDSPVAEVMGESLPEKYNANTELTVDIVHGDNEHDFVLTTTDT